MTAVAKYLFDLDLGQIGPDGVVRRKQANPDAEFTHADLERARAEALAEGSETGRNAALAEIAQATAQALAAIAAALPPLLNELPDIASASRREALSALDQIAHKLLPALIERGALQEILAVVGASLDRLRQEPRIVIRVKDSLLDPLQHHLAELRARAGFEGKLIALADDRLAIGDVHVEWADGGVERDIGRIWRDIDNAITGAINAISVPTQP
jgi:flagellar assembly protein FliH